VAFDCVGHSLDEDSAGASSNESTAKPSAMADRALREHIRFENG